MKGCGARESAAGGSPGVDHALRVIVPQPIAEAVGAVLMDRLGPFEEQAAAPSTPGSADDAAILVFYPAGDALLTDDEVLAALPPEAGASGHVRLERVAVSRDWVEGWKDHFRPIVIGEVRIRPPWEPALDGAASAAAMSDGAVLADVVINPGLGFGTGLHPTTRGTLQLLQSAQAPAGRPERLRGPLVDAGTGSGILAIAAAKLGWGPVFAFDNDPVALESARENIEANGVGNIVEVHRADVGEASPFWFAGATVLANMTLEPVVALVRKLARDAPSLTGMVTSEWPYRLVVSGVLAGDQEQELVSAAGLSGFIPGHRVHEGEWVSVELLPAGGSLPSGRR